MTGAKPVRTCIGCKKRDHQSVLLRVAAVADDGSYSVVADVRRRLPGRGAWIHPDQDCLHLAVRRHAFPRALRLAGGLDVDEAEMIAAIRLPI
jgi:hypothetical protein